MRFAPKRTALPVSEINRYVDIHPKTNRIRVSSRSPNIKTKQQSRRKTGLARRTTVTSAPRHLSSDLRPIKSGSVTNLSAAARILSCVGRGHCAGYFIRTCVVGGVNDEHLIPVVLNFYGLRRPAHHVVNENEPPFGVFAAIGGDHARFFCNTDAQILL
jgi:hypothetical protein